MEDTLEKLELYTESQKAMRESQVIGKRAQIENNTSPLHLHQQIIASTKETMDARRELDDSTHDSDTDGDSDDGDEDMIPELSFNESDLTHSIETSYEVQSTYWKDREYIKFEPLASEQENNVIQLVETLRYMLLFPTPTENQIFMAQDKWDDVMDDYNTTEQIFQVTYAEKGFKQSGVNVFERYVQFRLGYRIELSEMERYYQEWCNRAMLQQERKILQQERAMLQQAANTTPAVAGSEYDTVQVSPTPSRSSRNNIILARPTTESKSRERTPTAPLSRPSAVRSRQTLSDSRTGKQHDGQGAATNAKKIATHPPSATPSLRETNRTKNEAKKKEAAALAASSQNVKQKTQGRNTVTESAVLAGLEDQVNGQAYWTQLLSDLLKRRASVIQDLMTFNAGLKNKVFLDRHALLREIASYKLYRELIRSMHTDTITLVERGSKYDAVVPLLEKFTSVVKQQEAQIDKNYFKLENMREEFLAKIKQREDAARISNRNQERESD